MDAFSNSTIQWIRFLVNVEITIPVLMWCLNKTNQKLPNLWFTIRLITETFSSWTGLSGLWNGVLLPIILLPTAACLLLWRIHQSQTSPYPHQLSTNSISEHLTEKKALKKYFLFFKKELTKQKIKIDKYLTKVFTLLSRLLSTFVYRYISRILELYCLTFFWQIFVLLNMQHYRVLQNSAI